MLGLKMNTNNKKGIGMEQKILTQKNGGLLS